MKDRASVAHRRLRALVVVALLAMGGLAAFGPSGGAFSRAGSAAIAAPTASLVRSAQPAASTPPSASLPTTVGAAPRFTGLLPTTEFSHGPVRSARPLTGVVALSYNAAAALAAAAASGFGSASWNLSAGAGLALPATETTAVANLTLPTGCAYHWIGTPPTELTLTGTPTSASVGTAAAYEFTLLSASVPDAFLLALVDNGTASLFAKETCVPGELQFISGAVPTPAVDSTGAVAVADRVGGSAFLRQYPNAVKQWSLYGGGYAINSALIVTPEPSLWDVYYTAGCSPSSSVGGTFAAEIDPGSGAVITNSTYVCAGYPVTFSETGLPTGTPWSVSFSGSMNTSTTSAVGFAAGNGSWTYAVEAAPGYAPSPSSGNVTITGAAISVSIRFASATTTSVTFQESGLPSGTAWQVTLGAFSTTAASANLSFTLQSGSTPYTVTTLGWYQSSPANGTVLAAGTPLQISISFRLPAMYNLTFRESGLPSGTLWAAYTFGGTPGYSSAQITVGTGTSLSVSIPNGTYSYYLASTAHYNASVPYGYLPIHGSAATLLVTFHYRDAYTVTFTETGLASGTAWYALVDYADLTGSASSTTLTFLFPNGTYAFTAGGAVGYTASPSSGVVLVAGAAAAQTIVFTAVSLPTEYGVTFSETGLATGTPWSVTLGGSTLSSTTSTAVFSVTNASYSYTIGAVSGYTASPTGGTVTVNGGGVSVLVTFTNTAPPASFDVTFSETGLAAGTSWSVTLGGNTFSWTSATIVFSEANGTYSFSVAAVGSATPTPASGSVTVAGAPLTKTVTFASSTPPTSYDVVFTETGLPAGTSWSVALGSTTLSSTTPTVTFSEPNGTYPFTVGSVSGDTAAPASGSIGVSGATAAQTIQFTSTAKTGGSTPNTVLGLPALTAYAILGIVGLLVVVAIVALLLRGRGRRPQPTSTPGTPPPGTVG